MPKSLLRFILALAVALCGVWTTVAEDIGAKIAKMQFLELAQYFTSLPPRTDANVIMAVTKRLYEIAYYDNHIPEKHREMALELLDTVKSTTEEAFKHRPDIVAEYRSANRFMEDNVRRFGVGSLSWLIREHNISKRDIVQFIARPEYAHLLEDFYSTFDPAVAEQIRLEVARLKRSR